jgi:hypothetical protein
MGDAALLGVSALREGATRADRLSVIPQHTVFVQDGPRRVEKFLATPELQSEDSVTPTHWSMVRSGRSGRGGCSLSDRAVLRRNSLDIFLQPGHGRIIT